MSLRHTTLALAVVLACARPQPSPEYERARQIWTELVRARGTDAADDPATDEVLALLARVPPSSLDAAAAQELKGRIEAEKKGLSEERARRERGVEGTGEGGSGSGSPAPGSGEGAVAKAPGTPEQASPGTLALPRLELGMKLDAFRAAYGECFEDKGDVELVGHDGKETRPARMWRMKDDESCRAVQPKLVDKVIVFAGDELAGLSPASALQTVQHQKTVELGRLPDGGLGIRSDGGVEPLPAGATLKVDDGGTVVDGGTP